MNLRTAVFSILAGCVTFASAMAAPTDRLYDDALRQSLKAEVKAVRSICTPKSPIRVQFLLHNTSDAPLAIPLSAGFNFDDGVGLPAELLYGRDGSPTLEVEFENDVRTARLPAPTTTAAGDKTLLLAPHATLGAEIDLQEPFGLFRYTGQYRVVWRPLDGLLGAIVEDFTIEPRREACFVTDYGKVTFQLCYEEAPLNVANFLDLVESGFYDNTRLHSITPGVAASGGRGRDDTAVRTDGRTVPAEFHNTPVELGVLVMAHKLSDPDSASCQFFIALGRVEELDNKYTVIGRATDEYSLRTLERLNAVKTNSRHQPLTPVIIRSASLRQEVDRRLDRDGGATTVEQPTDDVSEMKPE